MPSYSVRDVERVLRLAPDTTRKFIRLGFVHPARGPRREYRFSFQDLIVLRTARALIDAKVPTKRIHRSLESLRRDLPESMPLSGLSISAIGEHVVVRDGTAHRQVESGQYLLGLDVSLENGELHVVARGEEPPAELPPPAAPDAPAANDWFSRGLTLEDTDPDEALSAYRHAAEAEPETAAPWINWGRLLHAQGKTGEAAQVYRKALQHLGPEPLLLFNQGVLLEDLGETRAALEAYQGAIAEDPQLADCHFNLARLYEALGKSQHAIRHLGQYRRLVNSDGR
ncbi:MAG TPA: tetratricopeptide repeat protein [Steroidobacteraceae bacterium]|jgi:tetratricopeptide (TPR) repeat protein